jgi:hypothetical protein
MDEPVRDTRDVEIVVYPTDEPTPGAAYLVITSLRYQSVYVLNISFSSHVEE